MALEDFNFKVKRKTLEHIRYYHMQSKRIGSYFHKEIFPNARAVVDEALKHIQDYSGQRLEREAEFPFAIGFENIIALHNLPGGIKISQERRVGKKTFYVITGMQMPETNIISIIAGPSEKNAQEHGFYTIFPGHIFPSASDEEFWSQHAFVRAT